MTGRWCYLNICLFSPLIKVQQWKLVLQWKVGTTQTQLCFICGIWARFTVELLLEVRRGKYLSSIIAALVRAQMGTTQTQLCFILGIWARFGIIYFLNRRWFSVESMLCTRWLDLIFCWKILSSFCKCIFFSAKDIVLTRTVNILTTSSSLS